MTLTVPELSLVLLVGPSGAGKTTFAARHFGPHEVLSSDHYRGVVSNDETSLDASADAFEILEAIAEKRLARGLLTVIDATNVQPEFRRRWVHLAKRYHVLPVAIVFDVPPRTCHARNQERPDRGFGFHVVRRQASALRRSAGGLKREGFRYVHRLRGVDEIEAATIDRPRAWTDRRDDAGPFDIIGDVHGCFAELSELLAILGYTVVDQGTRYVVTPPPHRRALFLGDLVDRGPASDEVLRLVMDMVDQGVAICLPGNHEAKLLRHLRGKRVRPTHGLDRTIAQLAKHDEAFRDRVARFIDGLVSHFVLDGGRLVVAHAGMREDLAGRASGKVRSFALYGDTTGETDAFGLPVRLPWARDYRGAAAVVYGHTPVDAPEWLHNTLCIDTGCVFGGELTALRWPERELVSVAAHDTYAEALRPDPSPVPPVEEVHGELHLTPLLSGGTVQTRLGRPVRIRPDHAVAALEALSRFAEDPRWLVYLPPTMAPVETSTRPDLLEHPDEAFAYFRRAGIDRVVCEEKHMGSRAVILVGRDPEAVVRRFGFPPAEVPQAGIVLTRRGRRFFRDPAVEHAVLDRIRAAADRAGHWEALATDWLALDAEVMPWSAKARALLQEQYAPVGAAGRAALGAAQAVISEAVARGAAEPALAARFEARGAAVEQYVAAYRRYCWSVETVDDLRIAPFHLLASEGAVHDDRDHEWHLSRLQALVEADEPLLTGEPVSAREPISSREPILVGTPHRWVALHDDDACASAVRWWEERTAAGSEGIVVKAPSLAPRAPDGRPLQPALKCRGPEYLRIIYGPEYRLPEHLDRLRIRAVTRKRALARRELDLGLEALHRFVEGRSLHDVHTCVFAILSLECEAIDPRL